jgi:hypothetical protein
VFREKRVTPSAMMNEQLATQAGQGVDHSNVRLRSMASTTNGAMTAGARAATKASTCEAPATRAPALTPPTAAIEATAVVVASVVRFNFALGGRREA